MLGQQSVSHNMFRGRINTCWGINLCLFNMFRDRINTRLATAFTHSEFHGMELVPDSAVEHLAYVAKCPQLEVNIGAVFAEILPEMLFIIVRTFDGLYLVNVENAVCPPLLA